jgi:hypothetical protein
MPKRTLTLTLKTETETERERERERFSFSCPWVTLFLHSRELYLKLEPLAVSFKFATKKGAAGFQNCQAKIMSLYPLVNWTFFFAFML